MSILKQTEKVCPLSGYGVYDNPVSRFSCDASDEDILSDYENSSNDENPVRNIPLKKFCLTSTKSNLTVWAIVFLL